MQINKNDIVNLARLKRHLGTNHMPPMTRDDPKYGVQTNAGISSSIRDCDLFTSYGGGYFNEGICLHWEYEISILAARVMWGGKWSYDAEE